MKVKNYSIHPSVYFIVAALLIAYFFPREGKFRYQFYEGKPWRYGLLTAPSDFPIYKTDAEVQAERDSALRKFEPYYRQDATVESKEIDKLRADYQGTLRNRATPAYMQYIENSLQKLYRDGIISTQDMDELKKRNIPASTCSQAALRNLTTAASSLRSRQRMSLSSTIALLTWTSRYCNLAISTIIWWKMSHTTRRCRKSQGRYTEQYPAGQRHDTSGRTYRRPGRDH